MSTTYDRREPCANCPFRKDAKLAYWHPAEYLMLGRIERTEGELGDKTFGCHKDKALPREDVEVCIGWLLHQRKRGVPSVSLRIQLATIPELLTQFEESEPGGELYESISELVRVNIEADRELNPDRYEDEAEI